VSDAEKVRHIVTNHQNQPVELHLPSGLLVLPPRGRSELSETDLAAPQLRVLRASGLITTHEVSPAAKAEGDAEPLPAAEDETKDRDVPDRKPKSGRKP
jgi:hypothetical protein